METCSSTNPSLYSATFRPVKRYHGEEQIVAATRAYHEKIDASRQVSGNMLFFLLLLLLLLAVHQVVHPRTYGLVQAPTMTVHNPSDQIQIYIYPYVYIYSVSTKRGSKQLRQCQCCIYNVGDISSPPPLLLSLNRLMRYQKKGGGVNPIATIYSVLLQWVNLALVLPEVPR